MRQIKRSAFAKELHRQIQEGSNERLQRLSTDDIQRFVSLFWEVLAKYLYDGHRVIFEGWGSFFTNPVKRQVYDVGHRGHKWSFKYRTRFRPLDTFRNLAERDLSEDEYEVIKASKKPQDKK